MPKTSESPLYLYWDKALLLILAVAAVYVVLTRVVSSPIRSDSLGKGKLGPVEIVKQVSDKTEALKKSLQPSAEEPIEQSETVKKVRQYLDGSTDQLSHNPLTTRMPDEDVRAKTATPTVLTPDNIRAQSGIGIMPLVETSRTPATTYQASVQMYWVTIAADFPFQKQYLAFAGIEPKVDEQSRLDKEDQQFIFARLELERQQLRGDDSWSETQSIDPYQTYNKVRPKIAQSLSELYSLPLGYEEKDLKNRDILRNWLTQQGFSEFIVRPEFLPLEGFEQWNWPQEPPEISGDQTTDWLFAGAIPNDTAPRYIEPKSTVSAIPAPLELPVLQTTRTGKTSTKRVPLPQNYRLDDAPESIPIWAHDASVEPGVTYRYRLRVSLFNPLCGSDRAERSIRRQGWLTGPWSTWSKPVKTLQNRYFFFTGASPAIASRPSRARLSLYAWDKGYWFRETFYADPGQGIGAFKEVADPKASESRQGGTRGQPPAPAPRIKVDFITDFSVVEFNPNIEVKRPVADKPGEFQNVTTNELVVKNTKTGQTAKRYSDLDKDDPRKQALDEKIKRQRAALRPPPPH